jgi:PKD repeat protein
MAEKEEVGKKSGGWFKTLFGAVAGLVSGAVAMYVSAFVNQAVKPAKPIANFRVEHDGLTVKLQNLTPGFSGWWDFGDGNELVPVAAGQDVVSHTYPKPGDYSVKMSLRNILGEENERSVELHLSETAAVAEGPPVIEALRVEPVSPGGYAPATFKVVSQVKNAKLCIWDVGDQLEVLDAGAGAQERFVTFQRSGGYMIKLAAVNGEKHAQKSVVVPVMEPPDGMLGVVLTAVDAGTHVKQMLRPETIGASFNPTTPAGKPSPFTKDLAVPANWTLADVVWKEGDKEVRLGARAKVDLDPAALGKKGVQQLHLEVSPDRRSVRLTGALVQDPKDKEAPSLVLPVTLVVEQRTQESKPTTTAATLTVPGAGGPAAASVTPPPPPAEWVDVTRTMQVELRDGGKLLKTVPLTGTTPASAKVVWQNRNFLLTASPDKDKVKLQLAAAAGRPGAE